MIRGFPNGATHCVSSRSIRLPNKIGLRRRTRGTETSKYPEEEKVTTIPSVAASESGTAQTVVVSSLHALPQRGRGVCEESVAARSGSYKGDR